MTDWKNLLTRYFDSDPCDGAEMKFGPPATNEELDKVEQQFGFLFPAEFRSLYSTCNGYAVVFDNKHEEALWEFRPLSDLKRFVGEYQDSIASTHREISGQFFPFYDWSTGDSAGYLVGAGSELLPGIYDFHHERYGFDETQDYNEFLVLGANDIASYLEGMIAENEGAG